MKYLSSIKQLFIFGLGVLTLWFMSAQFVIPSGIDNALQIIQRILVTTTWTSSGDVVLDLNTWANNIYINPNFLSTTTPYSGDLVLTLDNLGYLSLTNLTNFIENNSFNTNGDWTFDGDTTFNSWVTFNTGPVNFNDVTTNFSGWIVNNTNNTINYGTSTTITYSSGTTVIFSTWVTLTWTAITWPAGATWPQGPQGPAWSDGQNGADGATGSQGPMGPTGATGADGQDGIGVAQNLLFDSGANILSVTDWNTVELPFWSLWGNTLDNANKILGTLNNYTLRIFAGGLERMTVLRNNGYVWINNTNPEKQLHVNGAIASSLIKVSTWGTNIDFNSLWWHYENLNNIRPTFLSYDRSTHYTTDNKAFFFPLPEDTDFFSDDNSTGSFLSGIVQYMVFIDVQDVNTVILEPWENEIFYVWWFINGTPGQKLSVVQREFNFDWSGNSYSLSVWLPSPFFEAPGSWDIINGIPTNTLKYLFSQVTSRWSSVDDSFIHFPSHSWLFDGWFYATYNWTGASWESFAFQVLNMIGYCNLPLVLNANSGWPGTVCIRWVTYVYDGDYWLRTYWGI